jgi:hypothetical protein
MAANAAPQSSPAREPAAGGGTDRCASAAVTSSMTLHRFGQFLGAPDSSPFVIKAMMLLKLAGISYRDVPGNPLNAPKKLLPYI